MANPSTSGKASSSRKSPTALGRLGKAALSIGHKIGLLKATPQVLSERFDNFQDVFLGDTNWLTGQMPLEAREPDGRPPRRYQYQPGYNIQIQPRSTETVTFQQIRNLSEYTIVRIVIERIKESMKAHNWDIVAEEKGMGNHFKDDIKTTKNFFEKPDNRHDWDEWLGQVIEEILVPDALTIYPHRTRSGKLWGLEVIDGTTIKVLADERGFEPLPPAPAYQQFLYGLPYVSLTRDELIYRPRNRRTDHFYGFSPVEQTIITINMGIRRELYDLAQFTDGTIPEGVATLPKDWGAEEIKQWQEYWDEVLRGSPQKRAGIRWIPGGEGSSFTKFRNEEVFGLHNSFDEWMARILCYAFGLSPQAFVQLVNRATAEEMGNVEAEQGMASIKRFIERLINHIIDNWLMMPHLNFVWTTDQGRLAAKRVDRNVKYAQAGIVQIDEIREEEGLPPYGLEPGIMTPQGWIPFGVAKPEDPQAETEPGLLFDPIAETDEHARSEMHEQHATSREPGIDPGMTSRPGILYDNRMEFKPLVFKAMKMARLKELGEWERWALKRVGTLEKMATGFKAEFLTPPEIEIIQGELLKAKLPDEVRHIFATRKKAIPPMRLQPPRAGEAAGRVADLRTSLRSILLKEAEDLIEPTETAEEAAEAEGKEATVTAQLQKMQAPNFLTTP